MCVKFEKLSRCVCHIIRLATRCLIGVKARVQLFRNRAMTMCRNKSKKTDESCEEYAVIFSIFVIYNN